MKLFNVTFNLSKLFEKIQDKSGEFKTPGLS